MPLAALILSSPPLCLSTEIKRRRPHLNPNPNFSKPKIACSAQPQSAKQDLLDLISDQERGLKTQKDARKRDAIIKSIDAMAIHGRDTVTTDDSLSATWRLLWTTEKKQLFVMENAHLFGAQAGDVLQVIDVEKKSLHNVMTFPPDRVFFVRSSIEMASSQRAKIKFTSAVLRIKNWEIPLPHFGQGWFETVYLDDEIRVSKDIVRGNYLVMERAPYNWEE
ncbi:hypothetical protein CCACVL1_05066 [Corchorus capsularis]|uniref:Plastid lipid-associated protein/fibrillin conserved domain-containing protein n=1 Tax=Corchorus capsularis TaxID=210143 RepID=A0A1R3JN23_COCAP|nr:hypothetical protein CCACVL1_05066 [Corchorus capsularis]